MRSKDKAIFKQAFDELSQEGYFEDFAERVNHLQPVGNVEPKALPTAASRPKVYYDKQASAKK